MSSSFGSEDMRIMDVDGDGDNDVIAESYSEIVFFRNLNGAGVFESPNFLYLGSGLLKFDMTDLDGDADMDLLIYEAASNSLFWKVKTAGLNWGPPQPIELPVLVGPIGTIITHDLNADGLPDILFTHGGSVYWSFNIGGSFTVFEALAHYEGEASPVMLVGDIDGDGDLDHITAGPEGAMFAGLNSSATSIDWASDLFLFAFPYNTAGFQLLDVDADGDLDLVDARNNVKWAENLMVNGIWGDYLIHEIHDMPPTYNSGHISHLGCGNAPSIIWRVWPYDEPFQWSTYDVQTGVFSAPQPLPDLPEYRMVRTGDIDGDGYADLLLANDNNGTLSWYRNDLGDLLSPVNAGPLDTLCLTGDPFELVTATPAGGQWTGVGVSGNVFTAPASGEFKLAYLVADTFACQMVDTLTLQVLEEPQITLIDGDIDLSCSTEPLIFSATPPGGTWGAAADAGGTVDRSCEARPITSPVTYSIATANGVCEGISTEYINAPACLFIDMGQDTTLCINDPPLQLSIMGPSTGGSAQLVGFDVVEYPLPAVADGTFDPELHPPGEYLLWGQIAGGGECPGQDSITVTLLELPIVELVLGFDTVDLASAPILLSGGMPAQGVFTIAGSEEEVTEFDPMAAGLGTHEIVYTWTDLSTGCSNSDTAVVYVGLSVGISSYSGSEHRIHPNPFADHCTVTFEPSGSDRITIVDALGRVVDRSSLRSSPAVLDLSHLASGHYTLILEQNGQRKISVVMKQ